MASCCIVYMSICSYFGSSILTEYKHSATQSPKPCMQSILEEIQSVKNFTSNRENVSQVVVDGLVSSIIKQINGLKTIGPQDATLLSDALKDSPYGESGTATVNASIDAALSKTISTAEPSPDEPKQFFKNWWSSCTPGDWRTFKITVPWSAKLTCLVERANSIGCTHPDEQCCKWMLAMLLCACYSELPHHLGKDITSFKS